MFERDLFRARFTVLRRADHQPNPTRPHLDRLRTTPAPFLTAWDALQDLYQIYESRRMGPSRPSSQ